MMLSQIMRVGGLFLVLILGLGHIRLAASRAASPRHRVRIAGGENEAQEDVAAIRAVLERQVAAWNRGDLRGFMQGYWKSDELTFFSGGKTLRGWAATLKRYQRRYQSQGREMGQLRFVDLNIQRLSADAAFVRGDWELRSSHEHRGGLFTLVFRRLDDGWQIVHDHTSAR